MLNLLIATNIIFYYFVSNARERIYSYFIGANTICISKQALAEFQKIAKMNIHTLASVSFVKEMLDSDLFLILSSDLVDAHEVINIIEKYSMTRLEFSLKRRTRDLSYTDAEQILIAKKLGLSIASNDGYFLRCAANEGLTCFSPVNDLTLDISVKTEYVNRRDNSLFLSNPAF